MCVYVIIEWHSSLAVSGCLAFLGSGSAQNRRVTKRTNSQVAALPCTNTVVFWSGARRRISGCAPAHPHNSTECLLARLPVSACGVVAHCVLVSLAGIIGRCNSGLQVPAPPCSLNRYRWCVPPRARHASTAAVLNDQLCHHFDQAFWQVCCQHISLCPWASRLVSQLKDQK